MQRCGGVSDLLHRIFIKLSILDNPDNLYSISVVQNC